jgi:hypothetical protein
VKELEPASTPISPFNVQMEEIEDPESQTKNKRQKVEKDEGIQI